MLGRRDFAKNLAAATGVIAMPAVLMSRARAEARADLDLAIIGAGAAGLAAAHLARDKGLKARIFEARGRVGGRVFTDSSLGIPFDAGAFYIHFAERNPWREIAETLRVRTLDDADIDGGFETFRYGKAIAPQERQRRRGLFGRLLATVEHHGSDLSFAEAARQSEPEDVAAAYNLTLLSLGDDPDEVSVRDYARLDSGDDLVLPGGYGNLLARYAEGLDITLASPVSTIDTTGDGVRIGMPGGSVVARAAIVTVPVGVLQAGGIRFRPNLPEATHAALAGLRMGALTKVALKVEGTRFGLAPWTDYYDQGRASDLINFEFWPFDSDLVIGIFGGNYARELAKAGEAAAVDAIKARLLAILGNEAGAAIRGGRLAGWSAEPYSQGAYSIARPGHAHARAALEAPIAGRIWLAGEANAGTASMTAGGAALAARRAVTEIAQHLGAGAPRSSD